MVALLSLLLAIQAVAARPPQPNLPDKKKVESVSDLYKEAKALIDENENGNCHRAIELIEKVLRAAPKFSDAWFLKGYCEDELGTFDLAAAAYERAIAIDADKRRCNGRFYLLRSWPRLLLVGPA